MSKISPRAANVNAGVAAKFYHRDAGGIEEQGVKQGSLKMPTHS